VWSNTIAEPYYVIGEGVISWGREKPPVEGGVISLACCALSYHYVVRNPEYHGHGASFLLHSLLN